MIGSLARRTLFASVVWLLLTEGSLRGWGFALTVILVTVGASLFLRPPSTTRLKMGAAPRFIPFFLYASLRGAVDVAARAFRGPTGVSPAFHELEWRLPDGPARIFLSAVVGLLPGTLGVARTERCLRIHLLDHEILDEATLRRLEWHVGRLFGQE